MNDKLEMADLGQCTPVSLAAWVKAQEDKDGACPPCGLSVIAPWYRETVHLKGMVRR